MTVLAIAGSLRKASYNRALLSAAQELAPAPMLLEPFDLAGLPMYNADDEFDVPGSAAGLRARIRAVDAVLIATPEYNYSIPGVLKNAIDWGSQPYGANAWDGKPVAILGASNSSIGTARAQLHLRQCLTSLNMYVLNGPEVLIGNAPDKFDATGNLTDEKTRAAVRSLLDALAAWVRRLAP